jgi:hypothetical protein
MIEEKKVLKHLQQGVGGLVMLNVILDIVEDKSEIVGKMMRIQMEFKKRIEEDGGSGISIVSIDEAKDGI